MLHSLSLRIAALTLALPASAFSATHHVLIVDGSLAMTQQRQGAAIFEMAREEAIHLVTTAPDGDRFTVLFLARPAQFASEPGVDAKAARTALLALQPTHGGTDLPGTLTRIEEARVKTPQPQETVVTFFVSSQPALWQTNGTEVAKRLERLKDTITFRVRNFAIDGWRNSRIVDLTLTSGPARTGTDAVFRAGFVQDAEWAREKAKAGLLVAAVGDAKDGKPQFESVAEQVLDMPARRLATAEFRYRFPKAGDYLVQVRFLDHDSLPTDDVRTALVHVRDKSSVLIVTGEVKDQQPAQASSFFVEAALAAAGKESPYKMKVVRAAEFAKMTGEALAEHACVVLCDLPRIEAGAARRLEEYLEHGGSLFWLLGPHVSLDAYNEHLYRDGKGILPFRLARLRKANERKPFHFEPGREAMQSALLRDLTTVRQQLILGLAQIRSHVTLESVRGRSFRTVLSFADEGDRDKNPPEPALVEWEHAGGRNVLVACGDSLDWSSLAASPLYVILIHETMDWLTAPDLRGRVVTSGEPLDVDLPTSEKTTGFTLIMPDGRTHKVKPDQGGKRSVRFRWPDTSLSGPYIVTTEPGSERFAFVVHPALDAVRPGFLDREAIRKMYPGWKFEWLEK
jgi:hypothetical protein